MINEKVYHSPIWKGTTHVSRRSSNFSKASITLNHITSKSY